MIKICLLLALTLSSIANSAEIKWDLLKTLTTDTKTKKSTPGPALKPFIGKEISIKGFMMPLDYDSKAVSEFLFMPYVPSCMHVPPPPANQLILVKMKKGISTAPTFYPVELVGVLTIDSNVELESSFKIEGSKVKELKDEKQAIFNKD